MFQARGKNVGSLPALIFALCVAACMGGGGARAQERAPADVGALLRQVSQQSDIQAPGAPPYRLLARFHLLKTPGGLVAGSYVLRWVSPVQWREEISCPGYQEVRVAANGSYWEVNSAGRRSWSIRQLASTLHVKSHFRAETGRLQEEPPRADARPGTRCLAVRSAESSASRYCFAPALASARSESGSEAYEYSNFASWKERSFPRSMSAWLNGELALEVTVEELSDLGPPDDSVFSPPAGAQQRCLSPEAPELIDSREPKYPANAARTRTDGVVVVYVRIATDGKVQDPFVVRTPGPEFVSPTLEALAEWRFRPASCNGQPVPFDTTIEVAFQLR